MTPIAIRLLSQQLICQQFASPTELVFHMGAIQAQDYRMVRWAVAMRTRGFRRGVSLLLPPFDEYLIGYKSRSLVLAPEHTHHAHTNNGIFFPIVAHDGVVCGNWQPCRRN